MVWVMLSNEWIRYTRSFLCILILMKQSCDWVTWSWRISNTYIRWVCVHNVVTPYGTNWNFSFKRIFSLVVFFASDFACGAKKKTHIHQFQPRKSLKPNHFKVGFGMFNCKCNTVESYARFSTKTAHICQHIRVCIARREKNGKQFFRIRWLMNFLLSLMFVLNTQECTHARSSLCIQIMPLMMLFSFWN